ncbi:MAG: hypothetical protein WC719_02365 [Patescibacteria group bacterium]|jgi:hypothetical protein
MKKILEKNNFSLILWAFFYFFIFALLLRWSFGYLDPDLGWHLKVGEEIAQTMSMPEANHYNYTFTGNWVDHEWLSNLVAFEVYGHQGYIALSILFALLIVSVLVILNIWTRRVYPAISPFFIIIFQLFGVIASSPHFGVRMQESGLFFLVLILIIIYHYNKHKDWRPLLALVPIMYFWACLHGSFLIGLAIFFIWAGVKIVEKIIYRYFNKDWLDFSNILKSREILVFSGAALVSFSATLITPYKLKLYSFLGGYKDSFYVWHIQEWRSQFLHPFQYEQLLYLALVLLGVIFYIYYSHGAKRSWRLDLWTLVLFVFFIFLSFKSRRHFPLMFVATFVPLVGIFSSLFKTDNHREKPESFWALKTWLKWYLVICLFLATLLQLVSTNFTIDPFSSFRRDYPVGAVEYLKAHPQYDQMRLFNDYGWGGYLIWTLPGRQLFIDGRLPQVAYKDKTFLEEYFEFFKKDAKISEKMADYNIGLVLMPVKDEETRAKRWEQIFFGLSGQNLASHNYLRDYLAAAGDWQAVYYDGTAIIYKKIK